MADFLQRLSMYLSEQFVINAFIVGTLIALCSGLLGVTLVLKRFSFIGDGLSHVAFGATAIASILKLKYDTPIVLIVTVICAILLLRIGQNAKIKGDAAVALISVGALAIGYLLIYIFPTSSNFSADVCSTLFGSTSILTLKESDLIVSVIMSITVVIAFVFFYNKIFAVTFDESFASATGTNARLYNTVIAVIIAVIIVLAMDLVGSLLISALIIFPALSSMRIYKSFLSVTICASVLSIICALVGILGAVMFETPVGSTIVAVQILVFIIFSISGLIAGGKKE